MEFFADLHSLAEILQHIRKEAEKWGVDKKLIHKMELACEEAIVNIISYAYPEQKGKLFVTCEKKGHRFEITLRDQGVPFNPMDVDVNTQSNTPISERHVGGLGIYIIRKAIDEASYQREKDENILQLAFVV